MGAVSKKAFEKVSDYFFGKSPDPERDIILKPETLRESQRAQNVLNAKTLGKPQTQDPLKAELITLRSKTFNTVEDVHADWQHPAFKMQSHIKKHSQKRVSSFMRKLESSGGKAGE